jgi:hypothetical protein
LIDSAASLLNLECVAVFNNEFDSYIILENGVISRLSDIRSLKSVRITNFSFNPNELLDISKKCELRVMYYENYFPPAENYMKSQELNDCLFQIMHNIKDTVGDLLIVTPYYQPFRLPESFKYIRFLGLQTDPDHFESVLRIVFESESIRANLDELEISINMESFNQIQNSFRFREKIMNNCTQKPMLQLKVMTINVYVNSFTLCELRHLKFDGDEKDGLSRNSLLFKFFLHVHFPCISLFARSYFQ